MNFRIALFIFLTALALASCDNEVELTAEPEDTTVIYGLVNASSDTQFIKVGRAFLEPNANAIELAKEVDRLFYDSLNVTLTNTSNGSIDTLKTIEKPKDPGVFSTDKNILYFSTATINPGTVYNLSVKQPNGKVTSGRTTALLMDSTQVAEPFRSNNPQQGRSISFFSSLSPEPIPLRVAYNLSNTVAVLGVNLYLVYIEEDANNVRTEKRIKVPLGQRINRSTSSTNLVEINVQPSTFFGRIQSEIAGNPNRLILPLRNNMEFEFIGVDLEYNQYTSIYGPLDGIAQVRPEYTNIENGIGLFSSRGSFTIKGYLAGSQTNPTRSRVLSLGFVDP